MLEAKRGERGVRARSGSAKPHEPGSASAWHALNPRQVLRRATLRTSGAQM